MNLAEELRAARAGIHDVKARISELIESVVANWRPRFPQTLGWRFVEPDVLDIYQVMSEPGERAIEALARAGFRGVVFHDHPANAPDCACVRRGAAGTQS
jgi:hypothetical protein